MQPFEVKLRSQSSGADPVLVAYRKVETDCDRKWGQFKDCW